MKSIAPFLLLFACLALFALVMLALYALMIKYNFHINTIIILFGLSVSMTMWLIMKRHARNQRQGDSMHLIGIEKH